jgi:hypothetical protein
MEYLSNTKQYFNAQLFEVVGTYHYVLQSSIAFFAMLGTAFYAALWKQCVANEICFLLPVNT